MNRKIIKKGGMAMEQVTIKNKNLLRHLAGIMMATVFFVFIIPSHGMALTPSGTVVGNQASATYNDSVGNQFTAQSNLFTITVSQVAGVSVSPQPGQSRSGAPANEVQFPHTVKNIGNGTDTFNLATVAGGAVTLNSITIIRDDNGNGIANPGEPAITSVTLDMDQSQMIVVRGTVPNSAGRNDGDYLSRKICLCIDGEPQRDTGLHD
ncbi:MAG: hypothetical protein HY037_00725 [Nitrospirae bacterium]|nr:hypothetical protein [Candidatus Troglogloeales bacterium]